VIPPLRLGLLVILAACAGSSKNPTAGPEPAVAQQDTTRPPPSPLNTQGVAGQVVTVLPATLLIAEGPLAQDSLFRDRTAVLRWADSVMGDELLMRAPEVSWKLPPEVRKAARRAAGFAPDPDHMGQSVLRDPKIREVPDPLRSSLRTLIAITGGRVTLVPASLVFAQEDSTVSLDVIFSAVDVRRGAVVWRSQGQVGGATPEAALRAAMAAILPAAQP
jgi:hypothetical protein